MRLADYTRLNSNATKTGAMVLRDLKSKYRQPGLTTLTREMKAGGPGSGPRPGLGNLNDKELMLHHAMLERAGQPNTHTAAEIQQRKLSPEEWQKFQTAMRTTHGIRLGGVPTYKDAGVGKDADFRLKNPTGEPVPGSNQDIDDHRFGDLYKPQVTRVPADELAKIRSRPSMFSADLKAGGPGSGRHKEMASELEGRGFQRTKGFGLGNKLKFMNGDHAVYVAGKDDWSHYPTLNGGDPVQGRGVEALKGHLDKLGVNGRQLTHYEKLNGYPVSMPIKDRTPENHLRNTFPQHFK